MADERSTDMAQVWNEANHSSAENDKLIEEIKQLIEKHKLPVELVEQPKPAKQMMAAGCTRCTLCPCMICW
jgi:hypothetical protein